MDLENFPTSESAKKMLRTVTTGFYEKSYVGKWIFQVMGQEMDDADEKINELCYQIFPETATWGIDYHEQKCGISGNSSLSLDERRIRVIEKRNLFQAMNPAQLERQLIDMTGSDDIEVVEHSKEYSFDVWIRDLENAINFGKTLEYIRKVKPSHMRLLLIGEYTPKFIVEISGESQIEFISPVYPRFNYPELYLDGTWLLDGKYSLGGFKAGENLDFYPVFFNVKSQVTAGPDVQSIIRGSGGKAHYKIVAKTHPIFRLPNFIGGIVKSSIPEISFALIAVIGYGNQVYFRMEFKSSTSGRSRNEAIFKINASPRMSIKKQISGQGGAIRLNHKNNLRFLSQHKVLAESAILTNVLSKITECIGTSSVNKCSSGYIINPKSDSGLVIEHDWWTLDGTSKLDGTHGLNPWVKQEQLYKEDY